jgi:hypothetical protein
MVLLIPAERRRIMQTYRINLGVSALKAGDSKLLPIVDGSSAMSINSPNAVDL